MKSALESILLVVVAFFAPIEGVLGTTLLLVLLDLITGVLSSRKQGIPITSSGFKTTVIKLLVYESALVLAYLVGVYLTGPNIPVLHMASSLIGLTELKSVYENINILGGGSLLTSVISAIQGASGSPPPSDPPPTA